MPTRGLLRSRVAVSLAVAVVVAVVLALAPALSSPALEPDPDTPADTARADLRVAVDLRTAPPKPEPAGPTRPAPSGPHEIHWRQSRAVGLTYSGSLDRGVMLPSEGRTWVSWDPVERDKPNRWWRRWGTDDLVRITLATVRAFAADHPGAPRILIGDLSRPRGGDFGAQYGSIGHVSHQNGLDVDVYYPRLDRREWPARLPEQVDDRLAQDLVDRFVAAGAEKVFVGPNLPLTGPAGIVVPLDHHDDHLHFRLPAAAAAGR